MPVIDADTHVDETEDTWEYMLPSEQELKPVVGYPSNPDPNRPTTRYWIIDGERQPRLRRSDERTHTKVEARELLDVKVRTDDMDSLGVQTHVIYPTMFLIQPTLKPETDLAIKRSYNRWLGDRCIQSGGRLRWNILPPLFDMDATLEELRWGKEHGAVGVLKKGDKETDRYVADPYFFPLWKEAQDLDLAICFHTGSGIFDRISSKEAPYAVGRLQYPVLIAFQSIIQNGVSRQFPRLRWAFIEAGASWLPLVLYNLERRIHRPGEGQGQAGGGGEANYDLSKNILIDNNMFVTTQVDEDLTYLTKMVGDDCLVVGSDYTHADQSQERDFQLHLADRVKEGALTQTGQDKILYDNPKRLYAL
jgi:uncharacterized protein